MKKLINRKANHFGKEGFTLIELLVVIAIIGLLSTMAVLALGDARQKTRDAKRQSDLKVLQTAIELYVSDNGSVPTPTTADLWDGATVLTDYSLETILAPYLPAGLPEDPSSTPREWMYCFNAGNNKYLVATSLEQETTAISGDLDTVSNWTAATECFVSSDGGAATALNCGDLDAATPPAPNGDIDGTTAIVVCLGSDDDV